MFRRDEFEEVVVQVVEARELRGIVDPGVFLGVVCGGGVDWLFVCVVDV